MSADGKPKKMIFDTQISNQARDLVFAMNPYESRRFKDYPIWTWPQWAQRDYELMCNGLLKVKQDAEINTKK